MFIYIANRLQSTEIQEKLTCLNSIFVCVIPEMSKMMHVSSAHQLSYIAGGSMLAHECFIFSQHSKWPQFLRGLGFFNVMYMPTVIAVMILLSLTYSPFGSLAHMENHIHTLQKCSLDGIYSKNLSTFKVNHVAVVTACIDIKVCDGTRLKHLRELFILGNSHTHSCNSHKCVCLYT